MDKTQKKSLEDKAILIRDKKYVQVKDRVTYFNDNFQRGMIVSEVLSEPTSELVMVMATVYPDLEANPDRCFTGLSQARFGKGMMGDVALEVAETSAVGRALGFMGIGIIEGIASADEMNKVEDVNENAVENGATCKDCGAKMVLGKNGLYCKPCYIKWAEKNKK